MKFIHMEAMIMNMKMDFVNGSTKKMLLVYVFAGYGGDVFEYGL